MIRAKHLGNLSQTASTILVADNGSMSASPKSERANSVSYAEDVDANDVLHSSPPVAEQFVVAGMAAIGLLSDLVIYRIPMTDVSAIVASPSNSVLERTKQVSSIRPSNIKTSRKDRVSAKSSAAPVYGSKCTSVPDGANGGADKSRVEGVAKESGNSVESHGLSSDPFTDSPLIPVISTKSYSRTLLLVDMWGKSGNVEKAWEWYQAMLTAGLCPNVPTCNSLLSAFLRVHRLRDAYDLLQSMVSLGLNPSLQTYTLLLSCWPDGQNVRDHVSNFLDMMHSEDRESKRGLVDAVIDFFHKTGLKGGSWLRVGGCSAEECLSGCVKAEELVTLAWFRKEMLASGVCPGRIDIETGWGRRSRVTGASMVRQAVQELLHMFRFPFFTENGNSGCFVGCGEPLNQWLMQSYVERMHLL
ncbi:hypothetical protein SASPL_136221 [Salvia splendens]|uniref:Smr domain-containing protein n=1 Tax=Salvia splendens TaxID=180675 RepID=A0A8X8X059_SALSN|nr:hypothetical protein SASPL_136221 [Salvia splendens]